jgi:hypothetical protein
MALARDATAAARFEDIGVVPIVGSLDDPAGILDKIPRLRAVGHFAASQNPAFHDVNAQFINAVLTTLPAGAAFAMQSGSMVFGDQGRVNPATAPAFAVLRGRPDALPAVFRRTDARAIRMAPATALACRIAVRSPGLEAPDNRRTRNVVR